MKQLGSTPHLGWRRGVLIAASCATLEGMAACAGHVEQRQGADDKSYSTSATLHTNSAKALLERAHQAVGRGDFDAGLAEFQAAYQSSDSKPEHKAEALLGQGSVYANILNLKRDPQKALAAYRQLVHEFPDSKLREQAETSIHALESSGVK